MCIDWMFDRICDNVVVVFFLAMLELNNSAGYIWCEWVSDYPRICSVGFTKRYSKSGFRSRVKNAFIYSGKFAGSRSAFTPISGRTCYWRGNSGQVLWLPTAGFEPLNDLRRFTWAWPLDNIRDRVQSGYTVYYKYNYTCISHVLQPRIMSEWNGARSLLRLPFHQPLPVIRLNDVRTGKKRTHWNFNRFVV